MRLTGLLRLQAGQAEKELELPEGATVADALAAIQNKNGCLDGYSVLLERPGARGLGLRVEDAVRELLVEGSRITLLYRFAGG